MTKQRRPALLLLAFAPPLLLAACDTSGGGTQRVLSERPSPDAQSMATEGDATGSMAFTGFWGARRGDRGENVFLSQGLYTMSRYQIAGMALHTQITWGGNYTATADRLTMTIKRTSCPTQTAGQLVYGWQVTGGVLQLTASDGTTTTYSKSEALNVNAYEQDLGCFDGNGNFTPGDLRSLSNP